LTFANRIDLNNHKTLIFNMSQTSQILGSQADFLLSHRCSTIAASDLHLPGPDFVDRVWSASNRSIPVLRSMQTLYGSGRLAGSGYLSILPVDQGIEHSAGASFAPNPIYFDSENIVRLAIESGCNAVASTFGVLGSVARRYAHKIPFIVKINHNEFLSYPNDYDQIMFGSVREAWEMGAVAVGATIYFGSEGSRRQLVEIAEAFDEAHSLGMATILWCYLRNSGFKVDGVDYHTSTDLSSQANHLGVTIQADIIKQKLPTNNGGYLATKHGKTHKLVYEQLTTDHPIDLCRYQVANGYMGRAGLINSGGESKGADDLTQAVATAVINKRAGGSGLILGRKAFQRPMQEGIDLLHKVQDVYLDPSVEIA
jgi:class I fructose-bisphosphate aldolase